MNSIVRTTKFTNYVIRIDEKIENGIVKQDSYLFYSIRFLVLRTSSISQFVQYK